MMPKRNNHLKKEKDGHKPGKSIGNGACSRVFRGVVLFKGGYPINQFLENAMGFLRFHEKNQGGNHKPGENANAEYSCVG